MRTYPQNSLLLTYLNLLGTLLAVLSTSVIMLLLKIFLILLFGFRSQADYLAPFTAAPPGTTEIPDRYLVDLRFNYSINQH
jgi:hypothetical protein